MCLGFLVLQFLVAHYWRDPIQIGLLVIPLAYKEYMFMLRHARNQPHFQIFEYVNAKHV